MKDFRESLGWRNNNPLNIRYSKSNNWQGQIGSEKGFCTFEAMAWGFRASLVLLYNYMKNYNCCTISSIVKRWAPPSENDCEVYMRSVRFYMNVVFNTKVDIDTPLSVDSLPLIAYCMACIEMGIPVSAHVGSTYVRTLLIPALQVAVDFLPRIFSFSEPDHVYRQFEGFYRKNC